MSDQEKRRSTDFDHDMLTRIDANLLIFIEDFKEHKVKFEKHVQDDMSQFDRISRFMWMVIGGFAMFEVGIKLLGLFKDG